MRGATQGLLLLAAALVAAGIPSAVTASPQSTGGTLTLNAVLVLLHGQDQSIDCNDTQADDGAGRVIRGPVPGLGQVSGRYCIGAIFGPRAACAPFDGRLLAYRTQLTVAGKGDIHVAAAEGPCVGDVVNGSQTFTVTGGTGSYVGASGSGTLERRLSALTSSGRTGTETWTGTLEVPGLEFDVTRPTLAGATNKSVRAKRGAKFARVTFRVTAQDDRDGSVPVTCYPKSGSRFPLGRTRVSCSTTDTSANATTATFAVTVKKTR